MMAANNMNEMPIFQTVDTNSMEDSGQIFSQPLPVQTAATEAVSLPAPTPVITDTFCNDRDCKEVPCP